MCGIWMRTRYQKKVELQELLHPVQSLSHRGPDGYGWWSDENVALVHTRLSIIDLAGGAQPLQSFDRRWIGIVNGELYDYKQLRQGLIERGVVFRTHSDSEVLLNLYALDGAKGISQVSGEFSFIFYDQVQKKVHFGRDPFGVKPLFFEARESSFTLASEMKALQDEAPVFDPNYIKTFIARTMVPPETCLQNVKHVWPGRVFTLDIETKKVSSKIYYELPLFQKRTIKGKDVQEQLEAELRGAVKRRLEADVEVGCYLSGGIDSALVAALAVDLGARPKAFTVGFADRDFDESPLAASIAQDLGIEHHVVQLQSKNFISSLIRSVVAFENPVTNPHGAAKNLLSECASQKVKVVLSGEGSDEWLGGYAYSRINKIQDFNRRHPRFGIQALEHFSEREMGVNLHHLDGSSSVYHSIVSDFFKGQFPSVLGRLSKRRLYRYATGEDMDDRVRIFCQSLSDRLREENPSYQFTNWDLNCWIATRADLLHYILANVGDRQEMSNSLEGRTPFLDPRVVRVAGHSDVHQLIRGLTEKYALRKVGGKYLKRADHQRGKKPFFAPMKYLYLRENRALIEAYIKLAEAASPWLNWKNIHHFLATEGRASSTAIENAKISFRLTFFSMGILTKHLRGERTDPRGYRLPREVADLLPARRIFDAA